MADLEVPGLDQLVPAEWEQRAGRPSEPSPYQAHVQASIKDATGEGDTWRGAPLAFTLKLKGQSDPIREKEVQKHAMLLRRAGTQIDSGISVAVQTSVNHRAKTAEIRFRAMPKRNRKPSQKG